jgi:hypothetical protein
VIKTSLNFLVDFFQAISAAISETHPNRGFQEIVPKSITRADAPRKNLGAKRYELPKRPTWTAKILIDPLTEFEVALYQTHPRDLGAEGSGGNDDQAE